MPWVASVKTLAARPSSKREVHTKIPNSKLLITTISYTLSKKVGKSTNKKAIWCSLVVLTLDFSPPDSPSTSESEKDDEASRAS